MESEEASKGIENPNVVNKYREAASIAKNSLIKVLELCTPGTSIYEICSKGDKFIEEGLAQVFSNASIEKGIAAPTSVSVNNICGYYSPLPEESGTLNDGDLVKIELGVHIDGYIAAIGSSLVVGATSQAPVTGPKADVILAAHTAIQTALRLIRPGNSNYLLTDSYNKIAADYGCNMLEGVLSHEIKQHVIDGNKAIICKETFDQHVEEFDFGVNQAYILDVLVSTGEGKPRETEFRTTVFQRALDVTYNLKLKASRTFLAEVTRRFPTLLFSLNNFDDQRNARLGVAECLKHNILYSFPVLAERPNDYVAQFKVTVFVQETGTIVITPVIFNTEAYTTQRQVTDEFIKKTLEIPMQTGPAPKKQRDKKKKRKAKAAEQEKEDS
jgi:curved DNA binding protein